MSFLHRIANFISPQAPAVQKSSGTGGWTSSVLTSGSGYSVTGLPVTTQSALAIPAVYAAVRALSEDIAKMPVSTQRRQGDAWINDSRHAANRILRRPNQWHNSFDFWTTITAQLALRGNGYAFVPRDGAGNPTGMIPVSPDHCHPEVYADGRVLYRITHPLIGDNETVVVRREDMFHVRNFHLGSGVIGYSPIAIAAEALGVASAVQVYAARIFGNGTSLGGVLTTDGTLPDGAAQRVADSWKAAYSGVGNSHKLAILEHGLKYEKLALNAEESQFIESRGFSVLEIARIFRIPPSKLASLDNAHYANIEAENSNYVVDTLLPITRRIEEELARVLLFSNERDAYRFHFDSDALTRADIKTRFDVYDKATTMGLLSVNECRAREGLPPRKGGDEYRVSTMTEPDADGDGIPDNQE